MLFRSDRIFLSENSSRARCGGAGDGVGTVLADGAAGVDWGKRGFYTLWGLVGERVGWSIGFVNGDCLKGGAVGFKKGVIINGAVKNLFLSELSRRVKIFLQPRKRAGQTLSDFAQLQRWFLCIHTKNRKTTIFFEKGCNKMSFFGFYWCKLYFKFASVIYHIKKAIGNADFSAKER